MAKIQCPHCKAVNQDVSPEDPCWQCGTVLDAPLSAIDTGDGPATSAANPANRLGSSSPPIQKQLEREQDLNQTSEPKPKGTSINATVITIAVFVLALIVILVALWLKTRH